MYIVDTGASGSGASSPELFNEVDFIPNQPAPRPSPASSPKPVSISNAIDEEDLELDPPGPVFVDDFYYDYNFINFHEDLSYGSFEEPHSDLVDSGGWTAPPHARSTDSPSDTPVPTAGSPGAEEEDIQGSWSPNPLLSEASHSPPVLEQTPVSPLANVLTEEDTPMGAPELEFPGLPWPPASVDDMMTPVTPGNPDELLVREDKQSQPATPWSDRSTLSKGGNPSGHTSPTPPESPIPTLSSSPSINPTQASPSPDVVEVTTGRTVASDPVLEADLEPEHGELWPTVEVASPLLPPMATVPGIWGRDSNPLEPGTPTFSTPELSSQDLKTLTMPGTLLLTVPTDPRSPGSSGQPQTPDPEGTQSPGLLPTPAQETQTNSTKDPEFQPLQPSLADDGAPADPLPAKNASWQVGNWSQVGCTAPEGWGSLSRTLGLSFEQSKTPTRSFCLPWRAAPDLPWWAQASQSTKEYYLSSSTAPQFPNFEAEVK